MSFLIKENLKNPSYFSNLNFQLAQVVSDSCISWILPRILQVSYSYLSLFYASLTWNPSNLFNLWQNPFVGFLFAKIIIFCIEFHCLCSPTLTLITTEMFYFQPKCCNFVNCWDLDSQLYHRLCPHLYRQRHQSRLSSYQKTLYLRLCGQWMVSSNIID